MEWISAELIHIMDLRELAVKLLIHVEKDHSILPDPFLLAIVIKYDGHVENQVPKEPDLGQQNHLLQIGFMLAIKHQN